jgi:hypothetical protein
LNSTWKPLTMASACSGRWSHSHCINSWLVVADGATTASNPLTRFQLVASDGATPPHQFMASSDKWSHSHINSWLRLKTDGLYPIPNPFRPVPFSNFNRLFLYFLKNPETRRDTGPCGTETGKT